MTTISQLMRHIRKAKGAIYVGARLTEGDIHYVKVSKAHILAVYQQMIDRNPDAAEWETDFYLDQDDNSINIG